MKKVLIIGANGFVGKYLINEFSQDNYEIIACDIKNEVYINNDENIKYYELDLLDKEKLNNILTKNKPDYIINLAAISSVGLSWKIPDKTVEINVIGTINLLELVKQNNLKSKILLIGSSEEYENKEGPLNELDSINANNPYGISKIAQENFARIYREKYGLNIICTRSFNHIGIGQTEQFVIPSFCMQVAKIDKSKKPGKIFVGNLSAYRDFSDVRDIVKVYKRLLENETNDFIYNVGSGRTYKIEDILNYIISLSNQKIEVIIDKEKFRPIDTPYICCDNTKIKKYFDDTNIEHTIKEIFEYYKKLG